MSMSSGDQIGRWSLSVDPFETDGLWFSNGTKRSQHIHDFSRQALEPWSRFDHNCNINPGSVLNEEVGYALYLLFKLLLAPSETLWTSNNFDTSF